MDAEEIGIYAVVLDLLYDRGKPIPNDPRWLGSMINRSTRKAGRLIASLIERDKLFELDDCLSNMRVEIEMAKALKARNQSHGGGLKRWPGEGKKLLGESSEVRKINRLKSNASETNTTT